MKLKKHLFPYFLILAIVLTVSGLISANISFSAPVDANNYSFNVFIDNVNSENIDVISAENSSISYVIELNNIIEEYSLSFDVTNDSDFDVVLDDTIMDQLPEDLKNILLVDVNVSKNIDRNKKDNVTINYIVRDNLSDSERATLDKYKELKVNLVFNYSQK